MEKSQLIKSSISRNYDPASAGFLFVVLRIFYFTSTDNLEFCLSCDKVLEKGFLSYLKKETHPVLKNEGLMDIDSTQSSAVLGDPRYSRRFDSSLAPF